MNIQLYFLKNISSLFLFICFVNVFVCLAKTHSESIQCTSDLTCNVPYSVCKKLNSDGQNKNTCHCIIGYEPTDDGLKCKRIVCAEDVDCETQHENTVCNKHKDSFPFCECADRFKVSKNQESCVRLSKTVPLGGECTYGNDCGKFAECFNQKCQCLSGSTEENNGVNCEPVHCDTTTDCKGKFMDLACNTTSHQCYQISLKCPVGSELNADGHSCKMKICSTDDDCKTLNEHTFCHVYDNGYSRCECKNHFKEVQNKCVLHKDVFRLGNECENAIDCGRGTECSDQKCKCLLGNIADSEGINCLPMTCSKNEDCKSLSKELVCNKKNHQCINSLLNEISQIGEECLNDNQCGNLAECNNFEKKCQCKGASKVEKNGINCANVNCKKNTDCTAENEHWGCNVISQFCYISINKNSTKSITQHSVKITDFLFLLVIFFLNL